MKPFARIVGSAAKRFFFESIATKIATTPSSANNKRSRKTKSSIPPMPEPSINTPAASV